MSVHVIRRDPDSTATIYCSCGYHGPASMCSQHLYDVRVAEAGAEINRLLEAAEYLHADVTTARDLLAEAHPIIANDDLAGRIEAWLTVTNALFATQPQED